MPSGDKMRSLGVRKELLEPRPESRMVEDVILTAPDDHSRPSTGGELAFEPAEPVCRPRARVERNPARPSPGEKTACRVGQRPLICLLCTLAEFLPVNNREVNAASRERVVAAEKVGANERVMHHPPWKNARMEIGRRQRPGPSTHDDERGHAVGVR